MENASVNLEKALIAQKRKAKIRKKLFVASILVIPIINFLVFW